METLRKIGKTICLSSNDTLGHEVQKQFQQSECFTEAMEAIVDSMNDEERAWMCEINDGRSIFAEKMEELRNLSADYCVFDSLYVVIDELYGEEEGEDGDEDEENENDDGDEEGLIPRQPECW